MSYHNTFRMIQKTGCLLWANPHVDMYNRKKLRLQTECDAFFKHRKHRKNIEKHRKKHRKKTSKKHRKHLKNIEKTSKKH
jgi:hypothetical protein